MSIPVNQIVCGDCLDIMRTWPGKSVDCCVTSPPYWGLRDYGVDGQLGLEKTPEEYVAKMVEIFAEVHRVLKDEGTLWLNMGDSYAASGKGNNGNEGYGDGRSNRTNRLGGKAVPNLKPKDLCGIPWRVAFALQADGWYLRQDIIWHKPNPMPESVTDRCTKAHEYIFLLTKKPRYYYDADAIKEKANYDGRHDTVMKPSGKYAGRNEHIPKGMANVFHSAGCERWPYKDEEGNPLRNKRSVWKLKRGQWRQYCNMLWEQFERRGDLWTVTTKPYSEAHFATFPPDLIEPCILAGCPENGIVLDPFMGSGTTAMVAYEHNRNYLGCELNPEYIKMNRADKAKDKYALFENPLDSGK